MGKTAHDRRQREEHLQLKVGVDQAALQALETAVGEVR